MVLAGEGEVDGDGDAVAGVAPVVQKGDLGPFLVEEVLGGLTAPVVGGERGPLLVPGAGGVLVWLRRLAIYLQGR